MSNLSKNEFQQLPDGIIDIEYSEKLNFTSNKISTDSIKISMEGLPDGLNFNLQNNTIEGIPLVIGAFCVIVRISNLNGLLMRTLLFQLEIVPNDNIPSMISPALYNFPAGNLAQSIIYLTDQSYNVLNQLPNGMQNTMYNNTFYIKCGVPPYKIYFDYEVSSRLNGLAIIQTNNGFILMGTPILADQMQLIIRDNELNELKISLKITACGCFNHDTKILCMENNCLIYRPIQTLRSGDLIQTYLHGVRQIDKIGYKKIQSNPSDPFNSMYAKKDSDLIVSGGHSILLDEIPSHLIDLNRKYFKGDQQIDGKFLLLACVSDEFELIDTIDSFTYYHFILKLDSNEDSDKRFGVWANEILTEIPNKKYFDDCGFDLL